MKCDELKERWFEAYPVEGDQLIPIKVYSKKDTDEAIKEMNDKLRYYLILLETAQLVLRLNKPEALYSNLDTMTRLSHEIDVVARRERHQKYKRCLAMAKWCRLHDEFTQLESERLGLQQREIFMEYRRKAMWWYKWHKRWLELAKKFKEIK